MIKTYNTENQKKVRRYRRNKRLKGYLYLLMLSIGFGTVFYYIPFTLQQESERLRMVDNKYRTEALLQHGCYQLSAEEIKHHYFCDTWMFQEDLDLIINNK